MGERSRGPGDRLEGWKDIARFLQREESTARRWEREEGLPVRRHEHRKRASVYAYRSDLETWRASRGREPAPEPPRRGASSVTVALAAAAAMLVTGGDGFRADAEVQASSLSPIGSPATALGNGRSLQTEAVWLEARSVGPQGGISPDGTALTYVDWADAGNLAIRDLASGVSRRLTTDADNGGHFALESRFSPDGTHVAYTWWRSSPDGEKGRGEVRLLSLVDQERPPRTLWTPADGRYAAVQDWLPDGEGVVAAVSDSLGAARIVIVSTADGQARPIRSIEWQADDVPVRASPDGRSLAYSRAVARGVSEKDIFLVAVDGSSEVAIVQHPANDELVGWSPDGRHVLFSSDRHGQPGLWAQRIAEDAAAGEPELLVADLDVRPGGGISRDGTLYYAIRVTRRRMRVARLDMETGALLEPPAAVTESFVGANSAGVYSPDGETLAYISDRDGWRHHAIVLRTLATGDEREIPHALRYVFRVFWWPGSPRLLVQGRDDRGRYGVYEVDIASGETRLLPGGESLGRVRLTPDGSGILYRRPQSEGAESLQLYDVARPSTTKLPGVFPGGLFDLSPDGERIVTVGKKGMPDSYHENDALRLHPATGGDGKLLWSVGEGERLGRWATWTPDGRAVLVLKHEPAAGLEWRLWVVPVDGSPPIPTELAYEPANAGAVPLAVHPDGERIVYADGQYFYRYWAVRNLPIGQAD